MRLIFLLLTHLALLGIWQIAKCNGLKMPNSTAKQATEAKSPGKVQTQFDKLFENYAKSVITTTKGEEGQKIYKMITEINRKQQMFESVFGKTSADEENKIFAKDDQFKCLKEWRNEIYQNDPPLSQLLERLIAVQICAKEGLEYDNDDSLFARINIFKQSLTYAVFFMAIRHKIRLNSEKEEEEKVEKKAIDQQAFWTELANFYEEFELDKIGKKCHQKQRENSDKNGKENEDNNDKQRDERFFRFVTRAMETEWDGVGTFPNWQDANDDGAIRRPNRRKRRMLSVRRRIAVAFLILLELIMIAVVIKYFHEYIAWVRRIVSIQSRGMLPTTMPTMPSGRMPSRNAEIEVIVTTTIQQRGIQTAWLTAYQETAIPYTRPPNQECSICLAHIERGERVNLFPGCSHLFHMECILNWLRQHTSCPLCRREFNNSLVSSNNGTNGK